MFYFSVTATAKFTGRAIKRVECEKCRAVYQYTLVRTATAKRTAPFLLRIGSIEGLADEAAEKKLATRLAAAVDPVPCPACGWVQADMNLAEVERRFGWVRKAPYYLFFVGVALAFPCWLLVTLVFRQALGRNANLDPYGAQVNTLTCVLAAIGPILYYLWIRRRARRFDLNERISEGKRITEGRQRAVLERESPDLVDPQPWRPIRRPDGDVSDWRKD